MSHYYSNVIAPASVFISLLIGLYCYKALNRNFRILVAFLGVSITATIIGHMSVYFFHNSIISNNLYTLCEFPVLASFYYLQFTSKKMKKAIMIMTIAFVMMCICLMVIYYDVNKFDDYSTSIESLLLIFLSLALTNRRNQSLTVLKKWENEPVNWFNTGILLYFSGSFFVFLLINYFLNDLSLYYLAWNAHATFSICLNILFAIGFYKAKKDQEAIIVA